MTKTFWKRAALWVGGVVVLCLVVVASARLVAKPDDTTFDFHPADAPATGVTRLVVVVHGLSGREAIQPTIDLAAEALAPADLLVVDYDARIMSNANAYEIANELETRIHDAFSRKDYNSIVLVGHSMGAMILRKSLLWGHGLEQDRVAEKDRRRWVDHVERFVSLAGINRGWSIEPRPKHMTFGNYMAIWFGEHFARLTGTGQLLLSMQRGAPFVADSRVQWVRLARPPGGVQDNLPRVIHLLGDRDDIVSRADAQDLGVAKDTVFVTLAATDHASIAQALRGQGGPDAERRREAVRHALRGEVEALSPDKYQELEEDRSVERIVYVMHGIRDYGGWTNDLRKAIERRSADGSGRIAVVNQKYGYFPMGPFLLYWDRQKNVRQFMDEYTENIAQYPNATRFDFIGHSNGTYILASALQHYDTLQVGRVFFAGSVVPKHYHWRDLMTDRRVEKVVNVVATGDWVVAIFPKLYEQVADWLGDEPMTGFLDIGAAGFRGFQDADDPQGRVRNIQFAEGQHGTGVEVSDRRKLEAIVAYAVDGDERDLAVFQDSRSQWGWLDVLSNVSWAVWLLLAAIVLGLGTLAFRIHWGVGAAFTLVVLGLLTSI
jgi:predicted esterase